MSKIATEIQHRCFLEWCADKPRCNFIGAKCFCSEAGILAEEAILELTLVKGVADVINSTQAA